MSLNVSHWPSDGRVLIVIGGDDNYKDSTEEQSTVLSRWARRKVSSQFNDEFLDGRKSFIFSWDKEHRPIHEEAMLHFFDPDKKGKEFVPEPKVEATVPPEDPKVCVLSVAHVFFGFLNDLLETLVVRYKGF